MAFPFYGRIAKLRIVQNNVGLAGDGNMVWKHGNILVTQDVKTQLDYI